MLSKLIERLLNAFIPEPEQDKLDEFITRQQPTSVCDVEYWINVYDRKQYENRASTFSYHYR